MGLYQNGIVSGAILDTFLIVKKIDLILYRTHINITLSHGII